MVTLKILKNSSFDFPWRQKQVVVILWNQEMTSLSSKFLCSSDLLKILHFCFLSAIIWRKHSFIISHTFHYKLSEPIFPLHYLCKCRKHLVLPMGIFCKNSQIFLYLLFQVYYGACEFLWCRRTMWSGCAALPLTSPLEGTNCGRNKVRKRQLHTIHDCYFNMYA